MALSSISSLGQGEDLVLVLAPVGRDAEVASAILGEVGLSARVCNTIDELTGSLSSAGAAILADEALIAADRRGLAAWVTNQPPWSDFPFILLTRRGAEPEESLTRMLGNVTLLERPFHPSTLANATRSAVRARRRQREAERTAERQALLIRELHHRVKNTLATVQAVVGATARSAKSIDAFYEAFVGRIISLANTHDVLTEAVWQTAPLRDLLVKELGPYSDEAGGASGPDDRVTLEGPPVDLPSEAAVPIGMAVHELTTNAAKYGALSVPTGRVHVRWAVEPVEDGQRLTFCWVERGGPPVEPPTTQGFGSRLLQRVLAAQLRAEVDMAYEPEGFRFRFDAILKEPTVLDPVYQATKGQ